MRKGNCGASAGTLHIWVSLKCTSGRKRGRDMVGVSPAKVIPGGSRGEGLALQMEAEG